MHSSKKRVLILEEQVFALQSQVSTLQNENDLMRASGNDFLKEKTTLKEYNSTFANIIANLNGYITQFQTSFPSTKDANAQLDTSSHPIVPVFYREQKIPGPTLFSGDRSKAQTWIMDIHLKLVADAQLFQNN